MGEGDAEPEREQETLWWKILRHFMLFMVLPWAMPFYWMYLWIAGFEGLDERQATRRRTVGIVVILTIAVVLAAGLIHKEFRYLGWL